MKFSKAITELPAYKKMEEVFIEKGYTRGVKDKMPIYCWDDVRRIPANLTPGHYVYALSYGKLKFRDVPEKYRTREFFLNALSGCYKDIVEYVKADPVKFDRQFYKDHIETDEYALCFELNDFEYMPIEFIDEELVMCAMFNAIIGSRRNDDWFYSVHRRKPEVLTQELYTLGARCFAEKRGNVNKFLDITPEEYRTPDYYFALCLQKRTPVMDDVPESVLTTNFLVNLINDSPENIKCFSEAALEREAPMVGRGMVKFWQAVVINDGYRIRDLELNEERVDFFLSLYDKDSYEYEIGFKDHYKSYLRKKNNTPEPENETSKLAAMMTLAGGLMGMNVNSAVDFGNDVMNALTDRQTKLPIHYCRRVPKEYSKKYDKEEYLLEIYKKLGIQVIGEFDYYYYSAVLPEGFSIVKDDYGYCIKNVENETVIHYYDRGPICNKSVNVDKINVTL